MVHQFLIIYEICPENMKVYSLITEDDALAERVRACHRQMGNTVGAEDDIQEFISHIDKFATLIYSDESEEDIKLFAKPVKLMGLSPTTELIHTGFIL